MCGRVRLSGDVSEIKIRPDFGPAATDFRLESSIKKIARPSADAKPSQDLPVWRRHPEMGEPTPGTLRWGLIPHWMKARPEIRPINARAETITEKRMFSEAYAKRRCIVPMAAFYERDARRKLHAFGLKNGEPLGVAGIWENWRNPDGQWERTFCIITVPPNALVAKVHDRMPCIIPNDQTRRWLGTEPDPKDLLRPYPADLMMEIPLRRS
jgi:putative SOS response-associated peptidase YedK